MFRKGLKLKQLLNNMKKLIAYFIKYPIYSNAIIIITAIAGILSLSLMPKSFFPELSPNKIYVNVS